jgi:hypothetical protein
MTFGSLRNSAGVRKLNAMLQRSGFLATLATILCGSSALAGSIPESPNFSEHIAPIIYAKCTGCHREGQNAPFTLLSYAQIKKRAEQIADVTGERIMPPWHADPGVVTYANDRSLTAEQIALIQQWVEIGMPEGDPVKLPPPPKFSEGWQLGDPDVVVQSQVPYAIPREGADTYRNFVIPLNLEHDTWVNAIEFRPTAPGVVHHVLYFLDTTGDARKFDAADPSPGYDGMGRSNGNFRYLGGWDLGTQPASLGYGLAWLLPKGADLVLQVHYHPNGKQAAQDQPMLGLHLSEKPTARPWSIVPVPPFFGILSGINIPPGEKEYIKRSSMVLPVDVEAIAVNGHAHYLGKRMEMTATLPNGEMRWLLKMSDWNFAWQEDYAFQQPIKLPAGTRLDALISWDNSDDNLHQFAHPPAAVRWGPRSTDEMGTLTLTVMLNSAEDKKALHTKLKRTLTGQFIQRIFDNDMGALGAARSQINQDVKMADASKLSSARVLTQLLDTNQDGTLDDAELEPGIDVVLPQMRGFGEIGID